jgi:hypothetical protein
VVRRQVVNQRHHRSTLDHPLTQGGSENQKPS